MPTLPTPRQCRGRHPSLDEVGKAAGGGHHDVAAPHHLPRLPQAVRPTILPAVCHADVNACCVMELLQLQGNLEHQLPCRWQERA